MTCYILLYMSFPLNPRFSPLAPLHCGFSPISCRVSPLALLHCGERWRGTWHMVHGAHDTVHMARHGGARGTWYMMHMTRCTWHATWHTKPDAHGMRHMARHVGSHELACMSWRVRARMPWRTDCVEPHWLVPCGAGPGKRRVPGSGDGGMSVYMA